MEQEIGAYLRSRRARVQPGEAGLADFGGRRRVPGLRREELAQLAGVSVDYYVRLEQGRTPNVSDAVLDAIARVLRLDRTEREHLLALVRPSGRAEPPGQVVRDGARRMLEMMDRNPAFVLGRRMDVLAWNALAAAVGGLGPGFNVVRHTFLEPAARRFYRDWATVAEEAVAYLRLDAGRHPGDPRLAALVAEVSAGSPEFARLWAEHGVKEKTYGVKLLDHPELGPLDLRYETLRWPGEEDQLLVVYTAGEGSPALAQLAALRGPAETTKSEAGSATLRASL